VIRAPRSLRGRLLALVLGIVAAVWLAAAVTTWVDVRHELDELLDAHLAQAAALLVARQAGEADDEVDVDTPLLHRYAPKVTFQVFHEGRLARRSANAPDAPLLPAPRSGFATVTQGGQVWRVYAAQGAERDVQVYVAERADARADILRAVLRGTAWPMLLALPLLALAALWAVHLGLGPLRRLSRVIAERHPGTTDSVELAGAPTELVPMVDALNGLFGRIAGLMAAERRFTADAAHELRTPIAAIRAQAQVALGEAEDSARRQALARTLEGCDRASRLVDQMLTLARLDAAAVAPAARADLAALVRQVLADLAPAALAKAQDLSLEAPDHAWVAGDDTLLAVLVRNLVDNAVRYSPPGGRIAVRVAAASAGWALSVEDSGPGLNEHDLRRLGERFFRVPGSDESGSGLGWSIVQRVASVHGLGVEVGRSPMLGGLAVSLAFGPVTAAQATH
jgi:two-component system, OmpR family, sensor histidine kinase QseC